MTEGGCRDEARLRGVGGAHPAPKHGQEARHETDGADAEGRGRGVPAFPARQGAMGSARGVSGAAPRTVCFCGERVARESEFIMKHARGLPRNACAAPGKPLDARANSQTSEPRRGRHPHRHRPLRAASEMVRPATPPRPIVPETLRAPRRALDKSAPANARR